MFDARLDTRPTTNIPNLITRFHLVKTWLPKYCTYHKGGGGGGGMGEERERERE